MDKNDQMNLPTVQLTDETIVHRLNHGTGAEQNRLVEHLRKSYAGLVVQVVQDLGGNVEEDLEFLLNDSLLTLIEKVKDGSYCCSQSSLSTYFYAIAKNKQLNRLRKRKRQSLLQSKALPVRLNLNDVETKMNSKEAGEKVALAISQLDENCQRVLRKFWLEDKSMREISEELNITVDAAKQRNHRCMNKLRELLQSEFRNWFKEK